jgi:hypothetical protein
MPFEDFAQSAGRERASCVNTLESNLAVRDAGVRRHGYVAMFLIGFTLLFRALEDILSWRR